MAAPVASFKKVVVGLSVQFTDSSTNLPTSWNWNFGDGNTSTDQNPTHVYTQDGVYNLVLTATNTAGSNTYTSQVVARINPSLSLTIAQMVQCELAGIVTVDTDCFLNSVQKWQIYLQPIVPSKYGILEADTFNEVKWPSLGNVLIAKLVEYDQIMKALNRAIAGMGVNESGTSKAGVKYVETGPARVEFFNPADFWKTFFKDNGQSKNPGGMLQAIKGDLCGLASRLRVKLPMCEFKTRTPLFQVSHHRRGRFGFTQGTIGWQAGPLGWDSVPYANIVTEDFVASTGQTVFQHPDLAGAQDWIIIQEGQVLQADYNFNPTTGTLTLGFGAGTGQKITIKVYK